MTDRIRINSLDSLAKAIAKITKLFNEHKYLILKLEIGNTRTAAQNRLLWMWNGEIQKQMQEVFGEFASSEQWHEILVSRLVPSEIKEVFLPDGSRFRVGRARTKDFTVKQMTEYLEKLEMYCADNMDLQLSRPADLVQRIWGGDAKD